MTIAISPTLETEMESLHRLPAGKVTVERFMPEWSAKISGLSPGKLEQYAHGHGAIVAVNGNGAGEDILFRARSGSYADPQDGKLYVAAIKGEDLDDPTAWDTLFVDSGVGGLVYPAWAADAGAGYGGSLAIAHDAATDRFRVFAFAQAGEVKHYDFDYDGALQASGTVASHAVAADMQLGCCQFDEVFVLKHEQVEQGYSSWHKPIYGANIYRYYYSSGWQTDSSFLFHTHADGHALKDGPNYDEVDTATIQQWGKRACGGMAINQLDANTVIVSLGMTWFRRWGYNTHSQGLFSFIYYRDSGGVWRRNFEDGVADYAKDLRFSADVFARGSQVESNQVVVWSRNDEPMDLEQIDGAERIPRLREVVYARIDPTGRYLTHFQRLGSQDDLTAAAVVVVNHDGAKTLYALGWRSVYESPPAAFLCDVPEAERRNLEGFAPGFKINRNNQWGMNVGVPLASAAVLFEANSVVDEGNLVRVYHGIEGELVQIGQGYIDLDDPTISLGKRSHSGKLVARADKPLLDIHAESFEDILPQQTRILPPDKPIKYVARSAGYWQLVEAKWPQKFFAGQYPNMVNRTVYQLQSSMEAFTGGGQPGGGDTPPGVYGGGGKIWQTKLHKKGTFYSDVTWLAHSPMVDGAVQASVRMGDNLNYGNFEFVAVSGCPVVANIVRSNGLITKINWSTHDCHSAPDGVWNVVAQEAAMAGVICHAVQIGKKYAFVWEANSDFTNSSHLEDQAGRYWNSLVFDAPDFGSAGYPPNLAGTKGANKLYLVLSDYDENYPDWQKPADRIDDPNWPDHQRWVHRYVAGGITGEGLTVGKPADLKMQVLGGTIHCFYRPYTEPNRSLWRHAFSYNAGRFGAGKFGIVGRGHSGINWDVLWPGRDHINQTDNVVDFWDIKMTDGVEDKTMEENLRGYAWQGLTSTQFRSFVDEDSIVVNAGALYSGFNAPPGFTTPLRIENLSIDFDLQISASGGEAGVYCRAVDSADPKDDCVYIGLVVNSTYKEGDNTLNCYAVKRVWSGGVEDATLCDYSPSALHLQPNVTLPVRITVRGDLFSIWVGGNYIGHFGYFNDTEAPPPETARGFYFGLYATGQQATFSNIHVPELYEIPTFSLLDINQPMKDAMTKLIGKRKIKGLYRPTGELLLSYFSWHDQLPEFQNSLSQNQYQQSDRFVSVCHVEGAYTYAIYASPTLLPRGRRFLQYHNPDLMLPEHCYREAQMIVKEFAERMEQANFVGLPDLRVEPEDQAPIVVSQQGIDDDWLVDDVEFNFDMQKRDSSMTVSTRKVVEI